MAVNARGTARRKLIVRTARIWSRLYKKLVPELKMITHSWIVRMTKQGEQESSIGTLEVEPDFPVKFTSKLTRTLREAYAQGYWLNRLYVEELKSGGKYRGRVKLSDEPEIDELMRLLRGFIESEGADEWYSVIPQSAIDWFEGYVPSLSGVISSAVLEGVQKVMLDSLQGGMTLQERMKALRGSVAELEAMSDRRIESIARTEITRADTLGRLSSMKANDDVIGVEFSAIMDDRTTEICSSRHGLVMRLDDPRLPENTPPLHVNCLLGDTFVLPIGGVSAYSERVFNGDIIIIESAGGNQLAGTPNHPVLTSRGWIPLCEIKEGDYVICDSVRKRGNVINGENQQMVTRIKDAASTFFNNSKMRATPVPMTAEDFHHDGGQSNVAVIYTDRELLNRCKSSVSKQFKQHGFIFGNVVSSFYESCKSTFFFFFNRMCSAFDCFMSFLSKSYTFFWSSILHSYKLLFMPVTWFYVMLNKNAFNGIRSSDIKPLSNSTNTYTLIKQSDDSFMVNSVDGAFPLNAMFEQNIVDYVVAGAVFFADFHDPKPRQIIFDDVVSVERRRFCGHVYNLQTESGIYVANNIVTHNCRSLLLACTVYDYPDGLLTSHEFDEISAGTQRPEDIEEVSKILYG